jgi:hypothetical protein
MPVLVTSWIALALRNQTPVVRNIVVVDVALMKPYFVFGVSQHEETRFDGFNVGSLVVALLLVVIISGVVWNIV